MTFYIPAFWLGVIAAHAFWVVTAIVWGNLKKFRKESDRYADK